jgi:hypothetical protein
MQNRQPSAERSEWRDLALSLRHRDWGFDAPLVDIDFLVIEYDYAIPKALISYKSENALPEKEANRKAFTRLADSAKLPAFEVTYTKKLASYSVEPLNNFASYKMPDKGWISELAFVTWLYKLRNRAIPVEVCNKIAGYKML